VELVVQIVAAIAALGAPMAVEQASEEVGRRIRELGGLLVGLGTP